MTIIWRHAVLQRRRSICEQEIKFIFPVTHRDAPDQDHILKHHHHERDNLRSLKKHFEELLFGAPSAKHIVEQPPWTNQCFMAKKVVSMKSQLYNVTLTKQTVGAQLRLARYQIAEHYLPCEDPKQVSQQSQCHGRVLLLTTATGHIVNQFVLMR